LIIPPEESRKDRRTILLDSDVSASKKERSCALSQEGWLNLDKSKSGSFFRVEVEQIRHGLLAIAVAVAGITTNTRIDKSD
jgi:hypothetical protein